MLKRFVEKLAGNKTVLLLVMGSALLASVCIDARNYLALPSDMRNRIVGGRMIEDGLSPYFYLWKEGGSVRYYDTHTLPISIVSGSTATPFFHWAIIPIADFQQHQLNAFWFFLCYAMLGLCWLLLLLAMPPPRRGRAILLTAVAIAFTYTTGWRIHINVGQNYIFVPVAMTVCYYCLTQKRDWLHLLLFGVFATSLLLLRPISALFFMPILFYVKAHFKWLASAALLLGAYLVFVIASPVQKKNWEEYFTSVKVNVQLHQQLIPVPSDSQYDNYLPIATFEGIDINSQGDEYWAKKLRKGIENSNFYIFYEELFGHKPSIQMQTILGISTCLIMLLPLWLVKKKDLPVSPAMLLLLGYMLYNAYEFFSPINRGNYAFVQFIFPLLLLVLYIRHMYLIPIAVLLLGLYLNIAVLPAVKMEHNIGQFLIVVATLYLVYRDLIMTYFFKQRKLQVNEHIYLA